MIRRILLIQIFIISAFGQVIQELDFKLNGSQLSSDSTSLGFNVTNGTEAANGLQLNGSQLSSDSASLGFDGTEAANGLKRNLTIGEQLTANNDSKIQNMSTNVENVNNNQINSTVELRKKSILTTLTIMVNMTSKVVTQSSVFNVVNAKEAKTLSPMGRKSNNFTNGNLKINEKKKKNSISEFPPDFMNEEVSDHFSLV
jgi:hypothetical protein